MPRPESISPPIRQATTARVEGTPPDNLASAIKAARIEFEICDEHWHVLGERWPLACCRILLDQALARADPQTILDTLAFQRAGKTDTGFHRERAKLALTGARLAPHAKWIDLTDVPARGCA
jgi:hypothetical protein